MNSPLQTEHRRNVRHKVLKNGKIIAANSSVVIDVAIRDMSPGGARISVPASTDIPREFSLAILSEQLIYSARECWRSGEHMGVRFVGEPRPAVLRHRKHRASTQDDAITMTKPATTFPEPVVNATDDSHLQPQFCLRFERVPSHPGRGVCLVDVLLRNTGAIAACYPFFCLPVFGLSMKPASGWEQQDFTSVRKMRRFARLDAAVLDPGAAVHCCTISLGFRAANGGCLEFETGSEHSLDNLPDLKLMCIPGAGNYASKRIQFTVPASELRTFIERQTELPVTAALATMSGPAASTMPVVSVP